MKKIGKEVSTQMQDFFAQAMTGREFISKHSGEREGGRCKGEE